MSGLRAPGFPEEPIRDRARSGAAEAFPDVASYGRVLFGADPADDLRTPDLIDVLQLVPPVFVPQRLEKLIELGREPVYRDVGLETAVGGFTSPLPLYLSALGSTKAASLDLGVAASRQAGRLGIPMVIGENMVPVKGYGRLEEDAGQSLLGRIRAYAAELPDGSGGLVVQQSTEDADAEVWNLVYSDPNVRPLLESGRLAFELKIGQGAKPGLGGMTVLEGDAADRLAGVFATDPLFGCDGTVLRSSSPGTFTVEILRQQIRLMRNNYPRARVWVKLPPARDVRDAARCAWDAGADAVTVDGAEAGTGWAPTSFLRHVGLPLAECLRRIGPHAACLLVSGRMWEGVRVAKCLALGANAVGLGRAALIAVDEDPEDGLVRLVRCLALELRLVTSALGKYHTADVNLDDIWSPEPSAVPVAEPAADLPWTVS
ncbi:ferredoxin-dependent glutamate synthase [Amycolatopsis mediterranei S699]|uniref:Ferredoxin-dependent glutamate synthase n=3 Tax=Amycolatopsis mediterranei TaxID=33910 RepID=A0A0H3D8W9_AMYMU|nr:glutamate synthase-related protein [Amycolatopsis mediterranei]ADJ46518.1 ferredoxin-dependent glutamate synthase [Amycolatopsis mediterranei U32]AEK43318.1 ferredoxin-dependent glutamate synthase [Amycolatopsis mediterranei S699]AFO78229.1 ferredoxin-dependent glutamate synthase [Amycolatopsis mediterranei S699]AGT85357.1 ferredoxin-dependent glutamate synthase [Amycolatopsis mediterranei RB]KDO06175.1 glutamate synthase [Amycolatopsis mediterranei]